MRAEAVRLSVSIPPITSLEAFRAALGAYRSTSHPDGPRAQTLHRHGPEDVVYPQTGFGPQREHSRIGDSVSESRGRRTPGKNVAEPIARLRLGQQY